jgi:hypothetical protein
MLWIPKTARPKPEPPPPPQIKGRWWVKDGLYYDVYVDGKKYGTCRTEEQANRHNAGEEVELLT